MEEEKKIKMTTIISKDFHDRLKAYCKEREWTVSILTREALKEYLDSHNDKEGK